MALTFHYLSGSPFSWRVWLALEHKTLQYDLRVLRADAGDLKSPEYLSVNPHGKAPAIDLDGFSLYESNAIVEFLEERFPTQGRPLWPRDPEQRAIGRRMVSEADTCLYPPVRRCVAELMLRKSGLPDYASIEMASASIASALALYSRTLEGPFLLGSEPTAADYALYPLSSMVLRLDRRHPAAGFASLISSPLKTWRSHVEALPFFDRTYPPHWKYEAGAPTQQLPGTNRAAQ